jgi:glutaredoxin
MAKKESLKKKPATTPFLGTKGLVAGLIVIAVIISLAAAFYATSSRGSTVASVDMQGCGKTVITYLNANIAQAGATAVLTSVTEKNGVYAVSAVYQNRNITIYSTKDCSLLFTSSYNMKGTPTTPTPATSPTPTPVPEPVKTDKPTTELYVMSFCPFGVQAETAMEPVTRLLGSKADIRVRYIATVAGTTLDSVNSLHGPVEAKEDVRQLCIAKYYPAKLWPYLVDFNANCYSLRQNASGMEACLAAATKKTSIDNAKIEACATGSEGLELLKADTAITTANKITGSPTILINGQKYAGQRTADGYKQAICDRFNNPPAECKTNLSSAAAAASGSCG